MKRTKRQSPRRPGMPLPHVEENDVYRLPREMRRARLRPFGVVSPPPPLPDVCDIPELRRTARTVPLRGKYSGRARSSLPIPATKGTALFAFESFGESNLGIILATRRDLYDLAVQVGPVTYEGPDGRPAQHFIDIVFTDTEGRRTGFFVKNSGRAACPRFADAAPHIAAAAVPHYADAVHLVTEGDLNPLEVLNASRYLYYRRFPDAEAEQRVREVIKSLIAPVPIVQVMRWSGLGARAYRSVFCAIFTGSLVRCSGGEIDMWTLVKPGDLQ